MLVSAALDWLWLLTLPTPAGHTPRGAPAGLPAIKKPVDATVAAGPENKAAQPAGVGQAAAEKASDALERTRRAQELHKQLAECRAHRAEAHKALAASRARLREEEEEADRQEALEEQRAAAAAQQAPTMHQNLGD